MHRAEEDDVFERVHGPALTLLAAFPRELAYAADFRNCPTVAPVYPEKFECLLIRDATTSVSKRPLVTGFLQEGMRKLLKFDMVKHFTL